MTVRSDGPLLVTAFEPFGGDAVNASQEVLNALRNGAARIDKVVEYLDLPVEFSASKRIVLDAMASTRPSAIVCLGQASGRPAISLEKVAVNFCWFPPTTSGDDQPVEELVEPAGPAGYFSSLPIRAIVEQLQATGIPAGLSLSAGSYVCNYVFYSVMHYLAVKASSARAGFIHLPALPQQVIAAPTPSMALDVQVSAMEIVLGLL